MKRIVSVFLTMLIVMTSVSATVFATPNWKKGTGSFIPPGIAKKLFDDSDEVKWAQKAIERLKSKGLIKGTGGKYLPNNQVSKIEAVVMVLRIMDLEDEALSVKTLPKEYKGKSIPQWAIGYVKTAYEKGILDDVDMMYFNPNEAVKRYEVAKYVIRAVGKEDEAKEHMDEDLPFKDEAAIPKGAIGYVYMINELGIMKGDGKVFNPMGTLNRAEMAVLFDNLDGKVDGEKDTNEYTGTVSEINDDEIIVKTGNTNKTFEVSEDVVVYKDRTRLDYSDINEGMKVILEVEDGKVTYIGIITDTGSVNKIITRYSGEVTKISTSSPETITVKIDGMTATFNVVDDVNVYFKGVKGGFDEIKAGDDVVVTVDNRNRAIKIYVSRSIDTSEKKVEGTITKIDLTGDYHLYIESKAYNLSEDADVVIDDANADLEDLEVGMEVEAQIEDGIITSISAEKVSSEVNGYIESVGSNSLKVRVDDKVKEYSYSKTLSIDVQGHSDTLSSLEKGMKVELKLVDSLITSIYAEDHTFEVDGKIVDIQKSDSVYKLVLKVDGEEATYVVSDDVDITIENISNPDMGDLEEDMEGSFKILNNTIVKITIED